jgi:hypothetical protein
MQQVDGPESESKPRGDDTLGFIGLALAILGIVDLPPALRITCLAGASVLLPISFHLRMEWPRWSRWTLALLLNFFLGFVGWSVLHPR